MGSRYYYEGSLEPGRVELLASEAHHLIHVKRARLGESVELFDGLGKSVKAEVVELKRKAAVLEIDQQPLLKEIKKHPEVILASAVPKGERFRWLIEKTTEIGITKFIPLLTERSVVTPRDSKLEKHRQYVIEACKQSGRNYLMELSPLQSLSDLCRELGATTQIVVGHPRADFATTAQWEQCLRPEISSLLLIVGPEGGLTEQEKILLDENHAIRICSSPHILRTETAGLVLASLAISAINAK